MLTNLIAALTPLAQSGAIRLVAGSTVAGLVLLVLPGDVLLGATFLIQRGLILLLLWPRLSTHLLASSAVASLAVGLIYAATAISLCRRGRARLSPQSRLLRHMPFRIAAAALALLVTSAVTRGLTQMSVPELVLWMVVWLLVQSLFALLLASGPLQTGIGVLAFADAGRILYSLLRPDPLLWGVWVACDVLIALGAARLCINNASAAASVRPPPAVAAPIAAQDQEPAPAVQPVEPPTTTEGQTE